MFQTVVFTPLFFLLSNLMNAQFLEPTGRLSIETSSPGYEVFVNGVSVGRTPVEDLTVGAGEVEVLIRTNESQSWAAPDWVKNIPVAAGDTLFIEAEIQRNYQIRSKPFGARVLANGFELGTTPFVFSIPDTATRTLQIAKPGFTASEIVCSPETPSLRMVELRPINDFREAQIARLQESLRGKKAKRKRNAYLLAGVSFASALSAILLKQKADNLFDEYNATAEPNHADALFNRTKRFDRYAAASYGVFQISFGAGFYFFLRGQ